MSTTSEFILKKQVDMLAMRLERANAVIQALVKDIELTESAGCAFAFDLARDVGLVDPYLIERATERWDAAIAHLNDLAKAEAEKAK